ncbi:MAG: DUF58 domain-containing protein [Coriobacteriia bacterium]|nr:DUF58 domain-containing protein [Coriobacteriia bacterium]
MRVPAAIARLGDWYVTPRAALLVAVPAPLLLLARGPVAGWLAAAWALASVLACARDALAAADPAELVVRRELPPKHSIGVANRVVLAVENRSGRTALLTGRETPPPGFDGARAFGPLSLEPRTETEIAFAFTPRARGLYAFGDVGVRSAGPWGLAGRIARLPLAQDAKVYPDIQAVRSYALLARKGALAEMGVKRMRLAGDGTEFEALRDYLEGDDFRDIDWKASARRGKPIVRSFEVERSQTMVIAIDAGRLMTPRVGALTKLDRAVNAALMLAYIGTERDDLVGLLVFGRDVERYLPPRKGHRQFLAILEALYSVEGRVEEPDYDRAMRFLAAKLPKRSLAVVFTELQGREPSRRLLATLSGMAPRHLPLVITQRNRDIEARTRCEARTETDVFESSVAESLLADKAAALRMLQARGALVLDVFPEEMTIAAVNRYLEVKARGRL